MKKKNDVYFNDHFIISICLQFLRLFCSNDFQVKTSFHWFHSYMNHRHIVYAYTVYSVQTSSCCIRESQIKIKWKDHWKEKEKKRLLYRFHGITTLSKQYHKQFFFPHFLFATKQHYYSWLFLSSLLLFDTLNENITLWTKECVFECLVYWRNDKGNEFRITNSFPFFSYGTILMFLFKKKNS